MSKRTVQLSEKAEHFVSLKQFYETDRDDNGDRMRLLKEAVNRAVLQELTEKQRTVFLRYYVDREKIPVIAADLGLNKSTVARHLKSARNRLRRIFSYTLFPFLRSEEEARF